MPFRIDNAVVLFGLFALAIPVVLHLLQRRRYDTLDWGAMQFLPDSIATQRRRWLDEILLLLLRMAMIALIVLALATPISTSRWLAALGDHATRDVVIVLDGSYSMDARMPDQKTPWEEALAWMRDHVAQAPGSERFSILVARQPPELVRTDFMHEFDEQISIKPTGNADMSRALAEAWKHLQAHSKAPAREIIVVTDGQRHGWVDPATLSALDNLGNQWRDEQRARTDGGAIPSLRIVTVGGDIENSPPNYALTPLTTSRNLAKIGQKMTFRSALRLDGFDKFQPPKKLAVTIDGKEVQQLPLPENIELKAGQIPLAFQYQFDKPGKHMVSLRVDANDAIQGDNQQHLAIEAVQQLAVLCVDGDEKLSAESRSYFVQRALSAHAVSFADFKPGELAKYDVVVLVDVPHLSESQIHGLQEFVATGGGLLIVAGPRAARENAYYNARLHRDGAGLLPVRLSSFRESNNGTQPDVRSFQHPALELFRTGDALKDVRFPQWTKVQLGGADRVTVVATFTNGDPMLVEKAHDKGRVILCTAPLDRIKGSTFPSAWEFPVLLHELAFYLAGGRAAGLPQTPDLLEADLTRCTADDWRKVRDRLPVDWHDDVAPTLGADTADRQELWWLLLAAVIGMLCVEVWLTRRMALARG